MIPYHKKAKDGEQKKLIIIKRMISLLVKIKNRKRKMQINYSKNKQKPYKVIIFKILKKKVRIVTNKKLFKIK